jgi:branched-chain amino acid transport system substrate-binding protein
MNTLHRIAGVIAIIALLGKAALASQSPMPMIKIGAVVAESGQYAQEGRETRDGYNFWRDYVNSHGGLRIGQQKYRVSIVYLDDGSIPNVTALMTQKLIDDEHISFLLGPYGSSETLAASEIAEQHGIPEIAATGALDKIYDQGYHYIFNVNASARRYLAPLISFAVHAHPRVQTAAIVGSDDPFSSEVQQGAAQLANDQKIRIVLNESFTSGNVGLTALAQRISDAHADMVLAAVHYNDAVALQRALVAANIHAKMIGYTVGPDIAGFYQQLGPRANGVMDSALWSQSMHNIGGTEFYRTPKLYAAAFRKRYHRAANYHNAAASAAGLALELALKKAKSQNPILVRRALTQLNAPTFYGRIHFDSRGVNASKSLVIGQIHHGKLMTIYPKYSAQSKPAYPVRSW